MGISAAGAGVTHQISGTFAQTSMGTLALRVAPNGVADQLVVNGVARLAGTMQTVFQPGTGFSKSYNLVTATGGLTGTFSTLATQNLPAFLSASLAYGSTNVTLNLQSSLGTLPALGTNQIAVGQALDGAFNSGSGLNAMPGLFSLTANNIGYALTVLSGSNASVGQSNAVIAGGQFTSLLANRAVTRRAQPQTTTSTASRRSSPAARARARRAIPPTPIGARGAAPSAARSGSIPIPARPRLRRSSRSPAARSAATTGSGRRRCWAWRWA